MNAYGKPLNSQCINCGQFSITWLVAPNDRRCMDCLPEVLLDAGEDYARKTLELMRAWLGDSDFIPKVVTA